jgi:hypothetical protein
MTSKAIFLLTFFIYNLSYSQTSINRNFNLELSEDSLKATVLESSLNTFLSEGIRFTNHTPPSPTSRATTPPAV